MFLVSLCWAWWRHSRSHWWTLNNHNLARVTHDKSDQHFLGWPRDYKSLGLFWPFQQKLRVTNRQSLAAFNGLWFGLFRPFWSNLELATKVWRGCWNLANLQLPFKAFACPFGLLASLAFAGHFVLCWPLWPFLATWVFVGHFGLCWPLWSLLAFLAFAGYFGLCWPF